MKVTMLTAPMNTGRRSALRARAAIQVARDWDWWLRLVVASGGGADSCRDDRLASLGTQRVIASQDVMPSLHDVHQRPSTPKIERGRMRTVMRLPHPVRTRSRRERSDY